MKIKNINCNYCYTAGNLRLVYLSDEDRKKLSQQYSTEKWALSPHIYFVEYSSFSKTYRGYGIKNINGGVEFINPNFMDNPITLENYGYVFVANKQGAISENCCLFYDFPDYLAFISAYKKSIFSLPELCDCFILSHVRNFISMVAATDDYKNIFMFFPNNDTGTTIATTIAHRNPKHVHNCSILYAANETLQEYCNRLLD